MTNKRLLDEFYGASVAFVVSPAGKHINLKSMECVHCKHLDACLRNHEVRGDFDCVIDNQAFG